MHTALSIGPIDAPSTRGGIYVATHVDVIPPRKDDGVAALKRLGEDSRRVPDNVRFELVQQINRPNHFTVIEIWKDAKAVETHSMAAPTREFRDKLATMTGALYDERLYRAIDDLPTGYRTVFVMHDMEGYTHEEIGEVLGIQVGTSKAQLFRARAKLREALADFAGAWTA